MPPPGPNSGLQYNRAALSARRANKTNGHHSSRICKRCSTNLLQHPVIAKNLGLPDSAMAVLRGNGRRRMDNRWLAFCASSGVGNVPLALCKEESFDIAQPHLRTN